MTVSADYIYKGNLRPQIGIPGFRVAGPGFILNAGALA